ncbi:MAG TPA: hypothetical protein DC022_01400, partial [Alcanivorax sp.]|nr:hypothetical protein [Alcanivorax sp.]
MSPRTKNIATLSAIVAPFVLFFLAGRCRIDPWELPRENKGQLLIPHIAMANLKAVNDDGDAYTGDDMAGLWTILYVAGSECDTRCKNGLYYQMRQVRQTLGADVDRVRRVILHTATTGDDLN